VVWYGPEVEISVVLECIFELTLLQKLFDVHSPSLLFLLIRIPV
jgi:hypothetical protein